VDAIFGAKISGDGSICEIEEAEVVKGGLSFADEEGTVDMTEKEQGKARKR